MIKECNSNTASDSKQDFRLAGKLGLCGGFKSALCDKLNEIKFVFFHWIVYAPFH